MAINPANGIKIDLDRGVRLSKDPRTGMEVYMYLDSPGEYLTPQGSHCPDAVAAAAGYDIESLGKEKIKREKLAEFQRQLDVEFSGEADRTVLAERGDFKLVEVGTNGNVIITDNDKSLTALPMPRSLGEELFEKLAPAPAKQAKGMKSLEA